MQKARFKLVMIVLVGILAISTVLVGACSQNTDKPLDYKEVYIALYSHLIDIAQTPEAKEYVGLLFPAPPHLVTTTERHDDLKAWKIAVERWLEGTRDAFENAYWFNGDFDLHFLGFFDHATTWPAWFIYDDGSIMPLGRALLIEADIDKLNLDGMLKDTDINGKDIEIDLAPIHEVDVNIAESFPPQVILYINLGLKDGCTKFYEATERRDGNEITVTITTQRPKDVACPAVYTYFEKYINLGTDFVSGDTYIIRVNDSTTTFTMQ